MLYKFDKATLPQKQWNKAETKYKSEHPEIDFDKQVGVPHDKKWEHFAKVAAAKLILDKEIFIDNPEDLLKSLHEIKDHINTQPEILNKYDREECLKLIAEATNKLEKATIKPVNCIRKSLKFMFAINGRTHKSIYDFSECPLAASCFCNLNIFDIFNFINRIWNRYSVLCIS